MSNKPNLIRSMQLPPTISMQKYERYLPTAFDESLSILEKINQVIHFLYEYANITEEMLGKWNEVYRWVMNEGLDETIGDRLREWLDDGTFDRIINENIFNELNNKIDRIYDEFDGLSNEIKKELEELTNDLHKLIDETLKRSNINLTVGANGDFQSLQKAIDFVADRPVYPLSATITLLNGFVLKEQVTIENKDLSFLTIKSSQLVYAEMSGSPKQYRLNTNHGDLVVPFIYGKDSHMPTLDFKLRYRSSNISNTSYVTGCILDNSEMRIIEGNGFTHFPYIGLGVYFNSKVVGHKCDYSWNGNRNELNNESHKDDTWGFGLVVSHNSQYTGKACVADSCGDSGFICFRVSSLYIDESKAENCGHHALVVYSASQCSARKGIFINTIDDNVVIGDSSIATLKCADCSGALQHHGLIVNLGSRVDFEHGVANNCGTNGIEVQFNSTMLGRYAQASDNGMHGLFIRSNSMALFSEGQARRNGSKGVNVRKGSHADLDRAIVKNNVLGVHSDGATVSASGTTMSENTRDGLLVSNGGIFQGNNNSIVLNKRHGVKCEDGQIDSRDSRIVDSGEDGIHATVGADVNMPRVSIRGSGNRSVNTSNAKVNISEGECINSSIGHTMIKNGSELIAYNTTFSGGSARDLNINDGGRIVANGSNGSTNATPNNITQRGYIIM